MSKLKIECFGNDAELISFINESGPDLVIEFVEEVDGYVSLGNQAVKIMGKKCVLDKRKIPDGEHIPHLVLSDKTLDLPKLKKLYGSIEPAAHDIREIGELSLRERYLNRRVSLLEKQIEELTKKVYGSSLFKSLP